MAIIFSFMKEETGLERLSILLKVIWLINDRARIWNQGCRTWKPMLFLLYYTASSYGNEGGALLYMAVSEI